MRIRIDLRCFARETWLRHIPDKLENPLEVFRTCSEMHVYNGMHNFAQGYVQVGTLICSMLHKAMNKTVSKVIADLYRGMYRRINSREIA